MSLDVGSSHLGLGHDRAVDLRVGHVLDPDGNRVIVGQQLDEPAAPAS